MFFFKLPTSGPSKFTAHLIRTAGCDITLTSTLTFKWQCTFSNQFFWDMKQPHEINGSRCLERSKFLVLKSLEVILLGHCDYVASVTDKWINMKTGVLGGIICHCQFDSHKFYMEWHDIEPGPPRGMPNLRMCDAVPFFPLYFLVTWTGLSLSWGISFDFEIGA